MVVRERAEEVDLEKDIPLNERQNSNSRSWLLAICFRGTVTYNRKRPRTRTNTFP